MGRPGEPAGKEELVWFLDAPLQSSRPQRRALPRDLKLHRQLGFLLHDDRAGSDAATTLDHIRMAQISFSFRGGFWPSSLPLFHGTARPSGFVAVSMTRSFVE